MTTHGSAFQPERPKSNFLRTISIDRQDNVNDQICHIILKFFIHIDTTQTVSEM